MRRRDVLAAGAAILASGCSREKPAAPVPMAAGRVRSFVDYLGDGKARMIAYSPRDSGRIEPELERLREKFNGLVLYGNDANTPAVFAAATRLGYQAVMANVWDARSVEEIRRAAELTAKAAAQMSMAVSIGSEGLLEGRYTVADLLAAERIFDSYAGGVAVAKTTSEPWWRYLDDQPDAALLRSYGDFISIHVHVIWDADILDPGQAAGWCRERAMQIRNLAKTGVFVRETGFPGAGTSPRASLGGAAFSRAKQAEFWRAWCAFPQERERPFLSTAAVFEAVDNPAKTWRDFEPSWGLLAASDLRAHPAWDAIPRLG